tara:strand:- start:8348 stop:8911 length:564 start_codon:yes stop_codon:yes gene_type:complete
MVAPAVAQGTAESPSVRERILDKARERAPVRSRNWFELLDPEGTGYATRSNVEKAIQRRFSLLDTNYDRAIDRMEYSRRNRLPTSPGLAFDLLDQDRDGKLSLGEFSAPVLWRFFRLDADDDGRISREEAARYIETPSARSLPPLTGTCFDINGRLLSVSPPVAEALAAEGRRAVDCTWRPGASMSR